jgi:hypothetical protein
MLTEHVQPHSWNKTAYYTFQTAVVTIPDFGKFIALESPQANENPKLHPF